MTLEEAMELRKRDPKAYVERSLDTMARHVEGMLKLQKMGSVTFDYGNNIRTFAFEHGVKNAYDFPGFVPEYIRPLFCEGRGPVPLGGAVGRSRRHSRHRRSGAGDVPEQQDSQPLD